MKTALAFVLLVSIALYGCTQPGNATPTPNATATPTDAIQTCGAEQCHGLDITCGPNVPQACTMEFRIPDDACLQYVRCQTVNDACQQTDARFEQCRQCVLQCNAENQDGQTCIDRCAPNPTDAPTICTREYDPVCGTDEKTYTNACNARAAGATIAYNGACRTVNATGATPSAKPSGNGCTLMRHRETGQVACFGCSGTICKDPSPDFEPYTPTGIGIPYACYPTENGCELAQ